MPKQPEKELERLAGDFVLSAVRGTDASAQQTLELGDEGIRAPRMLRAVSGIHREVFEVATGQTIDVERLHFVE